jgi:Tfp pilus assembly protein PilO
MDQIGNAITAVLTDDKLGLSLKIILLVLGLGMIFFLKANLEKFQIWKAKSVEKEKEVQAKNEMTDNNITNNEQVKTDSKNIDDFLKGEK